MDSSEDEEDEESDDEAESDAGEDEDKESDATPTEQSQSTVSKEPVPITIQTALGNGLLDQMLELNVQKTRTVASVKESIRRQLPGKPPVACMQLVVDGKVLDDDIMIHDLMDDDDEDEDEVDNEDEPPSSSVLTLTLDMIPPVDPKFMTQVEERLPDMTTAELLQAFAVNEAALLKNAVLLEQDSLRLERKRQEERQDDDDSDIDLDGLQQDEDDDSDTSTFGTQSQFLYMELREQAERIRQDMEQTILASDAARKILQDDQPPSQKRAAVEVRGQRVRVPRTGGRTTMIKERIQRNLNVQWADTIRYCVLFLFFGYFGGRTPVSRAILLLGAPSVFVLQARPVKLAIKQLLYTILDHPPGIVLSLLPAPQQAILNMNYAESMKLLYGNFSDETRTVKKGHVDDDDDDDNDFLDAKQDEDDSDADDGMHFFDAESEEYDEEDDDEEEEDY